MTNNKSISLHPDWRGWFFSYLIGVITIPLLGLGLWILWRTHRNRTSFLYTIYDTKITVADRHYSQTFDLANIEDVFVTQRLIDKILGVGTVYLTTNASDMILFGVTNPVPFTNTLKTAIALEKKRTQETDKLETKAPKYAPGSLDKLDYLAGLWQQGLISDEDYKKEKKHFE
jgi:hypothetical protein